eukprot:1903280-Prymnesium_polylepis.1
MAVRRDPGRRHAQRGCGGAGAACGAGREPAPPSLSASPRATARSSLRAAPAPARQRCPRRSARSCARALRRADINASTSASSRPHGAGLQTSRLREPRVRVLTATRDVRPVWSARAQ